MGVLLFPESFARERRSSRDDERMRRLWMRDDQHRDIEDRFEQVGAEHVFRSPVGHGARLLHQDDPIGVRSGEVQVMHDGQDR